jgi:hypothetical protein
MFSLPRLRFAQPFPGFSGSPPWDTGAMPQKSTHEYCGRTMKQDRPLALEPTPSVVIGRIMEWVIVEKRAIVRLRGRGKRRIGSPRAGMRRSSLWSPDQNRKCHQVRVFTCRDQPCVLLKFTAHIHQELVTHELRTQQERSDRI